MKTHIDFTTEIPHHEDESAVLKVSISNYADGPIMNVSDTCSPLACVRLNRKELESLLHLMNRYDDAQRTMEGEIHEPVSSRL